METKGRTSVVKTEREISLFRFSQLHVKRIFDNLCCNTRPFLIMRVFFIITPVHQCQLLVVHNTKFVISVDPLKKYRFTLKSSPFSPKDKTLHFVTFFSFFVCLSHKFTKGISKNPIETQDFSGNSSFISSSLLLTVRLIFSVDAR